MGLTADSLMGLDAWCRHRAELRPALMAHRRLRSVCLGAHMTVQFEDERTLRDQIQEVLRLGRVSDPAEVQAEIDAYAPLMPDGRHWKATLLIEYPVAAERRLALARLMGVAECLYVQATGGPRIGALADEDLPPETGLKTAAVHFLRFEPDAATHRLLLSGAGLTLGCEHAHYSARALVPPATVASLLDDL